MQETTKTLPSFSLIELIFAILIIGILSTFAFQKIFNNTSHATLVKLSSDIATIQNGIKKYSDNCLMKNMVVDLDSLEVDDKNLFSKVLETPIKKSDSYPSWSKKNDTTYLFNFDATTTLEFKYDKKNLTFFCDTTNPLCEKVF